MSAFHIFGELIAGWLLADLVTGAFHWWEDRIARTDMPILGNWLILPNRLHHTAPMAFTHGSFLDRSQAAIVTATLIAAVLAWVFGPSPMLATLWLGGAFATEVHRLAHIQHNSTFVAALQQTGWLQSPAHHAQHHRPPEDKRYCVLTNMLNPILDSLRVWDRAERLIRRPVWPT